MKAASRNGGRALCFSRGPGMEGASQVLVADQSQAVLRGKFLLIFTRQREVRRACLLTACRCGRLALGQQAASEIVRIVLLGHAPPLKPRLLPLEKPSSAIGYIRIQEN